MCSLDITGNAEKPEQDKYKVRYHHNLQGIYQKKKKKRFSQVIYYQGFPCGSCGEEPTGQCRRHTGQMLDPWARKAPWRRAWQPTPALLPGESHGQRCLAGYRP